MGAFRQYAAVIAVSLMAAACASTPPAAVDVAHYSDTADSDLAPGGRIKHPAYPLQCVPYARAHSGIAIHGNAWTWWQQAAGHYHRGDTPEPGAVLVLDGYAGPKRAHLAVVRAVASEREIRVDHANWLNEGNIHLNDPVIDVSTDNDWSRVRVFNLETGTWGGHVYRVRGFIGPRPDPDHVRMAGRN